MLVDAVVVPRSDVIRSDGESLVQHSGSMACEERTHQAVVLLANDALSVELFPHCLTGPNLAAPAVMGQKLLGIVAPSDAVGTAKSWAGGTATYVSQELLCFSAGNVMRTLFSCFGAVLMVGG
jgi:hypothetical protein